MGHSSINVSLTYLSGLKIAELTQNMCLWFRKNISIFKKNTVLNV